MEQQTPAFIVGLPRSGTTLVSVILNAHSQLAISPETHYFTKYRRLGDQLAKTPSVDLRKKCTLLKNLLQTPEFAAMGFSKEEMSKIYDLLLCEKHICHGVILGTILGQYARKHGKQRWGEKTPGHFRYVPLIKGVFPDAKVISVIRDPRDVSLSLRKVPWSSNNVLHHAWHWRQYVQLSQRYRSWYEDDYLELRYEDLLSNPGTTLEELCDFLGLPFEPQMLAFHEKRALTFDPEREPWKRKAGQPLDPTNMMKWVREMPPEEVKVAELLASRGLKAKGYPIRRDRWNSRLAFRVFCIMMSGLGWSLRKKTARRWTSILSVCKRWITKGRTEGHINHEGG